MTNRKALEALREKVEAGIAINDDFLAAGFSRSQANLGIHAMFDNTRAIGSAVALLEAVLPGWVWQIKPHTAWCDEKFGLRRMGFVGHCRNLPARALLLATIKAKIEESDDE